MKQLYDGSAFDYRGHTFRVRMDRDEDMGEPWKEHDGHGIISDWVRRDKGPGERVLCEDHGSKRYYDVAATTKIAKRDGWGCSHSTQTDGKFSSGHKTKGEAVDCAVKQDYERMHAWCIDQWEWIYLVVILLDDDGEPTDERESLSGIESDAGAYLLEVAHELADEILGRVEVDTPDVQLSEN